MASHWSSVAHNRSAALQASGRDPSSPSSASSPHLPPGYSAAVTSFVSASSSTAARGGRFDDTEVSELEALQKVVECGAVKKGAKAPNALFSPTKNKNWKAWRDMGDRYQTSEAAAREFVRRVDFKLGTTGGGGSNQPARDSDGLSVAAPADAQQEWECSICTLLNPVRRSSCKACGTARDSQARDSSSAAAAAVRTVPRNQDATRSNAAPCGGPGCKANLELTFGWSSSRSADAVCGACGGRPETSGPIWHCKMCGFDKCFVCKPNPPPGQLPAATRRLAQDSPSSISSFHAGLFAISLIAVASRKASSHTLQELIAFGPSLLDDHRLLQQVVMSFGLLMAFAIMWAGSDRRGTYRALMGVLGPALLWYWCSVEGGRADARLKAREEAFAMIGAAILPLSALGIVAKIMKTDKPVARRIEPPEARRTVWTLLLATTPPDVYWTFVYASGLSTFFSAVWALHVPVNAIVILVPWVCVTTLVIEAIDAVLFSNLLGARTENDNARIAALLLCIANTWVAAIACQLHVAGFPSLFDLNLRFSDSDAGWIGLFVASLGLAHSGARVALAFYGRRDTRAASTIVACAVITAAILLCCFALELVSGLTVLTALESLAAVSAFPFLVLLCCDSEEGSSTKVLVWATLAGSLSAAVHGAFDRPVIADLASTFLMWLALEAVEISEATLRPGLKRLVRTASFATMSLAVRVEDNPWFWPFRWSCVIALISAVIDVLFNVDGDDNNKENAALVFFAASVGQLGLALKLHASYLFVGDLVDGGEMLTGLGQLLELPGNVFKSLVDDAAKLLAPHFGEQLQALEQASVGRLIVSIASIGLAFAGIRLARTFNRDDATRTSSTIISLLSVAAATLLSAHAYVPHELSGIAVPTTLESFIWFAVIPCLSLAAGVDLRGRSPVLGLAVTSGALVALYHSAKDKSIVTETVSTSVFWLAFEAFESREKKEGASLSRAKRLLVRSAVFATISLATPVDDNKWWWPLRWVGAVMLVANLCDVLFQPVPSALLLCAASVGQLAFALKLDASDAFGNDGVDKAVLVVASVALIYVCLRLINTFECGKGYFSPRKQSAMIVALLLSAAAMFALAYAFDLLSEHLFQPAFELLAALAAVPYLTLVSNFNLERRTQVVSLVFISGALCTIIHHVLDKSVVIDTGTTLLLGIVLHALEDADDKLTIQSELLARTVIFVVISLSTPSESNWWWAPRMAAISLASMWFLWRAGFTGHASVGVQGVGLGCSLCALVFSSLVVFERPGEDDLQTVMTPTVMVTWCLRTWATTAFVILMAHRKSSHGFTRGFSDVAVLLLAPAAAFDPALRNPQTAGGELFPLCMFLFVNALTYVTAHRERLPSDDETAAQRESLRAGVHRVIHAGCLLCVSWALPTPRVFAGIAFVMLLTPFVKVLYSTLYNLESAKNIWKSQKTLIVGIAMIVFFLGVGFAEEVHEKANLYFDYVVAAVGPSLSGATGAIALEGASVFVVFVTAVAITICALLALLNNKRAAQPDGAQRATDEEMKMVTTTCIFGAMHALTTLLYLSGDGAGWSSFSGEALGVYAKDFSDFGPPALWMTTVIGMGTWFVFRATGSYFLVEDDEEKC